MVNEDLPSYRPATEAQGPYPQRSSRSPRHLRARTHRRWRITALAGVVALAGLAWLEQQAKITEELIADRLQRDSSPR